MSDSDDLRVKAIESDVIGLKAASLETKVDVAGLHAISNEIKVDIAGLSAAFNEIKRMISDVIADETRHAKRSLTLVTMFVTCFSALFAVLGLSVGLIVYINYTGNKARIDDAISTANTTIADIQRRATDLLQASSLDNAEVKANENGTQYVTFNVTTDRESVDSIYGLFQYKVTLSTYLYVTGHRKDDKYGVGKLMGMHIKFNGPIIDAMVRTKNGVDEVAERYLSDGIMWIVTTNNAFIYVSTQGASLYQFSWEIHKGSCEDVHKFVNYLRNDNSSMLIATPALDYATQASAEKSFHVKIGNDIGEFACEQLIEKPSK